MAIGDITKSQIADHLFSDADTSIPYFSVCHIDSTYYAIVYVTSIGDGKETYLKTFNISNDGTSIVEVDSWVFELMNHRGPQIKKVHTSDFYAIFGNVYNYYSGVFTVLISTIGIITDKVKIANEPLYAPERINSHEGRMEVSQRPGTNYFVASFGEDYINRYRIVSISISSIDGGIGSVAGYINFPRNTYGSENDIVYVANGIFAIIYTDYQGSLHLITVQIGPTGLLTILDNEATIPNAGNYNGREPTICKPHFDQNIVAFAWWGTDSDGFLQTAGINSTTGAITLLSQSEYDTGHGEGPGIETISTTGDVMIAVKSSSVTYTDSDAKIVTFNIDTDGAITQLDSWDVGTAMSAPDFFDGRSELFQVGGTGSSIWGCVSSRVGPTHGHIFTFETESEALPEVPDPTLLSPVDAIPKLTSGR